MPHALPMCHVQTAAPSNRITHSRQMRLNFWPQNTPSLLTTMAPRISTCAICPETCGRRTCRSCPGSSFACAGCCSHGRDSRGDHRHHRFDGKATSNDEGLQNECGCASETCSGCGCDLLPGTSRQGVARRKREGDRCAERGR